MSSKSGSDYEEEEEEEEEKDDGEEKETTKGSSSSTSESSQESTTEMNSSTKSSGQESTTTGRSHSDLIEMQHPLAIISNLLMTWRSCYRRHQFYRSDDMAGLDVVPDGKVGFCVYIMALYIF